MTKDNTHPTNEEIVEEFKSVYVNGDGEKFYYEMLIDSIKDILEQKDREWRERMIEVLESMTFNNVFCCPRYIKGNCYCDALDRYKSHGKSNLLVRLKRWKQKQIKKLKDNQ